MKMDFVEKSIQFFIIVTMIILIYSYSTFKFLFNFKIYVTSLSSRKQYIDTIKSQESFNNCRSKSSVK